MKATNPENGTVSFAYNSDGTLLSKTDAKGQKIQFAYDAYARVTGKTVYMANGTADPCSQVSYYWDTLPANVGSSNWTNTNGRLMAAQWSASSCPGGQFTQAYQYYAGLVTTKRLYTPVLGQQTCPLGGTCSPSYIDAKFGYTNLGQLQTIGYPVWYEPYNIGLQPYSQQWPATSQLFTYSFDTLGRPVGLTDQAQKAWVSGVSYGGPSGQKRSRFLRRLRSLARQSATPSFRRQAWFEIEGTLECGTWQTTSTLKPRREPCLHPESARSMLPPARGRLRAGLGDACVLWCC